MGGDHVKIAFNRFVKDVFGEYILKDDLTKEKATLGFLSVNALVRDSEQSSGEEKFKAYQLAERIAKAEDTIEVSAEEMALIKRKANCYPTNVLGPMWKELELGY